MYMYTYTYMYMYLCITSCIHEVIVLPLRNFSFYLMQCSADTNVYPPVLYPILFFNIRIICRCALFFLTAVEK